MRERLTPEGVGKDQEPADENAPPTSPIKLLRKRQVAEALGVSVWTIDRWVKQGQFPRPIFLMDGSPAAWRERDVEAWLLKRRVRRREKPKSRGQLRRG